MPLRAITFSNLGDRLQDHIQQILKAEKRLSKKKRVVRSVHRIRVLSRRIEAILNLFPANDEKKWDQMSKKMSKQVRRFRKNLREVREMDVFQSLLDSMSLESSIAKAVGRLFQKKREKALRKVLKRSKKYEGKELVKLADKGLAHSAAMKMTMNRAGSEKQAQSIIRKIFKEREDLHRMRIDVKRLRYSLEALEGAMMQGDGSIKILKKIQGDLGQIHDAEMLRDYLKDLEKKKDWSPKRLQGVRQLSQRLNQRIRREREEWQSHWPEHRKFLMSISQELRKGNEQ